MGIEFLGNKKQLEKFIMDSMSISIDKSCHTYLDIFSGTGSVSAALKKAGYSVIANDFLSFATCLTKAILLNHTEPCFIGIKNHLGALYDENDPYGSVLRYLNCLQGIKGFVYHNYSPASRCNGQVARMYFTEDNAMKIDVIRTTIETWSSSLLEEEKALLISDLINATSDISNIAGTYGCYMKYWKPKALEKLHLEKSAIIPGTAHYNVISGDANMIIEDYSADVIYADPPYTKRQYSAYYHVLETICRYDNPQILGDTGLRRWQDNSSEYCYRRKAPRALADLISKAKCKYFVLSYNNEGQITHETILSILSPYGDVKVFETPYRRYKSNSTCVSKPPLVERLYILRMRNNHEAN